MKRSSAAVLDDLLRRYPALAACEADIRAAGETLIGAFRSGGKLLRGVKLFDRKDFEAAAAEFSTRVALAPGDVDA